MAQSIGSGCFGSKSARMFLGVYGARMQRVQERRPELLPGEWVEVKRCKTYQDLDECGDNRGLHFRRICVSGAAGGAGERAARTDNRGWDRTDEAAPQHGLSRRFNLRCSYMALAWAGVRVPNFTDWREIWLRRSDGHSDPPGS